jgi:hypothetical protein
MEARVDQFGNKWRIETRHGAKWAHGIDDDNMPCVRLVIDEEICVDLSKPGAFRTLVAA